MEMKRVTKKIISLGDYNYAMNDLIELSLKNFCAQNQTSIHNYCNWKTNCDKQEYLNNPKYKIYELKNRNSPNVVVANVKWRFLYDGKILEDKSIIVYLGSITKYPKVKEDENLLRDILVIIKKHFEEKSPDLPVDIMDLEKMKEEVQLYFYWKDKLKELEYRLSPEFYLSKSKQDKAGHIIINIKWGFAVFGKSTKPRYILKRYTVDKRFQEDLNQSEVKDEIIQVVKDHLNKISPVIFEPPLNT